MRAAEQNDDAAAPSIRAFLPFALAGALVVVGVLVVVLISVLGGGGSDKQQVDLRFDAGTDTAGWTSAATGVLVSTKDHRTYLAVQLTRTSDAATAPRLTTDFDGSGGGEALEVRCTSATSTTWLVDVGDTQEVDLSCDRVLTAQQIHAVESVSLGQPTS